MTLKRINYAYPTSAAASSYGHGSTGCYYISLHDSESDVGKPIPTSATVDLKECDRAARDIHWAQFSTYSKRYGVTA